MIKFSKDYDSVKGYNGESQQLTDGGHICRIQGARVEMSRNGNEMLVVAFDISEGSEFDGFFKKKHERATAYNSDAKWQGVFRANLYTLDGGTNSRFKGLIEAVEESNPGYNFKATNGDELTLKGKLVGFNFRYEEYEPQNSPGEVREIAKPFYAISVAKVREGVIPPAKKLLERPGLNGSYQQQNAPQAAQSQQMGMNDFQEVQDDELPF